MVEKLGLSLSLDTNETPVHGVPGISRYFDYFSVFYMNQHAAIAVASLANAPYYFLHIHLSIPYFTLTTLYWQGRLPGSRKISGYSFLLKF